jgi:hypothetical protein
MKKDEEQEEEMKVFSLERLTGTCVDGKPITLKNIVYMTPLNVVVDS